MLLKENLHHLLSTSFLTFWKTYHTKLNVEGNVQNFQKLDLPSFQSVFPLHTKANTSVGTLDSDIISTTSFQCQSSSSLGNPLSETQGSRAFASLPHVPKEQQSGSQHTPLLSILDSESPETCSSWCGDRIKTTEHGMASGLPHGFLQLLQRTGKGEKKQTKGKGGKWHRKRTR